MSRKNTSTITHFQTNTQLSQAEKLNHIEKEDADRVKTWPKADQEKYYELRQATISLERNKKNKKIVIQLKTKIEEYLTDFREHDYKIANIDVMGCGIQITPPLRFDLARLNRH